jgi:copper(I)-binding protein
MRSAMHKLSAFALLVVCSFLCSCTSTDKPPFVATDMVITEPIPGTSMSAGYVTLSNNTRASIELTHVVSPDFESIEMHESIVENGIAKMRRIDSLSIQAGSTSKLERGGKHLMLMRRTGSSDTISLSFYSGELLLLSLQTSFASRNN